MCRRIRQAEQSFPSGKREKVFRSFEHCSQCKRLFLSADRKPDGLQTERKTIEIIDTRSETEDFVLFGVRACDVKSFEILDRVFLSDPVDTYYRNRREHGIIMSLACSRPQETCFVHHSELMQVRPKVILFARNLKIHSISMQNSEGHRSSGFAEHTHRGGGRGSGCGRNESRLRYGFGSD